MGMATVDVYPRPRVKAWGNMWRVTWCDVYNQVWYRDFISWRRALHFATTGREPYFIDEEE